MSFTDETISVVIGGRSGIGRTVAAALSARPGRVEITSRSSGMDVSDPVAVTRYFSALGPVDHVVFTAGSQAPGGKLADVAIPTGTSRRSDTNPQDSRR
jgi:NADP-dependent 3-hydroxy acid dehydrogenase YdfG